MTTTFPPIERLIAFYPSRDLGASRAFYGGVLGLTLARDQGSCLIFEVASAGYLGFCRHDRLPGGEGAQHAGLILTLVTHDVDGAYAHLVAHGVACEGPPEWSETYGIYHLFARDPDGYRVEIQRFREPLA